MSGGSRTHKKHNFCRVLARFWVILAASRQVKKWCQKRENRCPTGSRLDPDSIPVGQKRWQNLCPGWIPTGSRLDSNWFSSVKTLPALQFPKFEHIFLKFEHLAVPPPSLKPNTGKPIYIYASKKLFAQI